MDGRVLVEYVSQNCADSGTQVIGQQYIQDQFRHINADTSHLMQPRVCYSPLFEVAASRVAHALFPQNFANLKFVNNGDWITVGYFLNEHAVIVECDPQAVRGMEDVYATAFFLGLEIRSYSCINSGGNQYLYIDDFAHPFHKISMQERIVKTEFRDHKILLSEKGELFPTAFINKECGKWLNAGCNIEKLQDAYGKILSIPEDSIRQIITEVIDEEKLIDCPMCEERDYVYYKQMDYYTRVMHNNYEGVKTLSDGLECSYSFEW